MGGSLNACNWFGSRATPQCKKSDSLPFLQSRVVSIVTQYLTPFVVTLTTTSWGVLIFCMTTNSCSPKTSLVLSFEFKAYMLLMPSSSSARSIFCASPCPPPPPLTPCEPTGEIIAKTATLLLLLVTVFFTNRPAREEEGRKLCLP